MSAPKHSKGTWSNSPIASPFNSSVTIQVIDTRDEKGLILNTALAYVFNQGGSEAEGKANAARIVACVNACDGMEDPAAWIRAQGTRLGTLVIEVKQLREKLALRGKHENR